MTVAPPSDAPEAGLPVWRLSWRLNRQELRLFWFTTAAWTLFFSAPVLIGLVLAEAFGALEDGRFGRAQLAAVILIVVEIARMGLLQVAALSFHRWWISVQSSLRINMLSDQLAARAVDRGRPVESPSGALAQFRDDTEDVARFIDAWIDVLGGLCFTVGAVIVLASVDPLATGVLVVPMVLIAVVTWVSGNAVARARRADRAATSAVTRSVGELVGAALSIKLNQAERPALHHLGEVMDVRRRTAVRDRVLDQIMWSTGSAMTDLGLGLVLLVAVTRVSDGELGLGELALFATYLTWLGFLPRMIGMTIVRRRYAAVSFERMSRLVADEDSDRTVTDRALSLHATPLRPTEQVPERTPLAHLAVRGLTVRLGGETVVDDVDLDLPRGTITVVDGMVGSGKTSLLRGILGLTWPGDTDGVVLWNGEPLEDRTAFLVPPNAAYLPQVPNLVSDSVAANVALGDHGHGDLRAAMELAQLTDELAAMSDGWGTRIGPRGLRLSGGQRQRVAAARAFVHRPELVVLDDLSSAVDTRTELALWDAMVGAGMTVLAVATRPVAHARADQVIELSGGRVVSAVAPQRPRGR